MDVWIAPPEVMELIQYHIAHNHPALALVDKEIVAVFKEKAGKRGGQVVLGVARRAPPILSILGKSDYKFILEIAADEWGKLTTDQRSALVDHLLCQCRVVEDQETHEMKFSMAEPEVRYFFDELARHGHWRPVPEPEEDDGRNVGSRDVDVEGIVGVGPSTSTP